MEEEGRGTLLNPQDPRQAGVFHLEPHWLEMILESTIDLLIISTTFEL